MRTFRRICDELDLLDMPAKMRKAAWAREDRVKNEYQLATRVVERLLRAQGGSARDRPSAGWRRPSE